MLPMEEDREPLINVHLANTIDTRAEVCRRLSQDLPGGFLLDQTSRRSFCPAYSQACCCSTCSCNHA